MFKTKYIGIFLIVIAGITFLTLWYKNRSGAGIPIVFSEKSMLNFLWQNYKANYIERDTGRTLDKQQDDITTSEGQSYSMMRAVLEDDQITFDSVYKWTQENLGRDEDHLFSWLFGKKPNGKYGVLVDKGGYNTASDADTDIALALIFAYERWHEERYINDAKNIINDIWEKEVVLIRGVPYMSANNLEKFLSTNIIINPSYLAPYAYRIFAKIDTKHDWESLVDSTYDFLNKVSVLRLDKKISVSLPPDWVTVNKKTGDILAPTSDPLSTNFGFDAFRTVFRIALDYEWNKDIRAKAYLDKMHFLTLEWEKKGKISSVYSHDGSDISNTESPAVYGGIIGYFKVSDPVNAEEIYDKKLKFLYSHDSAEWKSELGYYDDNWAWFGIALYSGLFPNFFSENVSNINST